MPGVLRPDKAAGPRAFSFADLEAQGRQLIEQARAEARGILEAARREAEELRRRQFEVGYQQGLQEGRTAGLAQIRAEAEQQVFAETRQQVGELINALVAALDQFEQSKRGLIAAAETGLIELAVAIARRVCRNALKLSAQIARANAKALLEMVKHGHDVELHFNPADYELLCRLDSSTSEQCGQFQYVRLVADEAVNRGGCVLQTAEGRIDAQLETQLDRIAATLLAAEAAAETSVEPAGGSLPCVRGGG